MIYIKKVILENFQSHKYTEMEFDKYLNVIVGPSDHGKTAIIRGIKWALFNEPTGDYFIREGENECSVTLIFSNNTKIKRYRNKSKNYYYIYDSDGNEIVLEGFGTKVPQEVVEKTTIKKILLDSNISNSINIGEQLEGPFLLSETTSTRANAIGRLVGVHIIDDALRDTLKDINRLKVEKKNYEETLKKLKEDLKEYDYLDKLQLISEKLTKIQKKIYEKQNKLNYLYQKLELLEKINEEKIINEKYLSKLKGLERISEIEKKLSIKIKDFSYISNRYNRLNDIVKRIERDRIILRSLKDIEKLEEYYKIISNKEKKLLKLIELFSKYNYIRENILENKNILYKLKDINTVEENIDIIDRNYNKLKNIIMLKSKMEKINKSLSIGNIYIEKLSVVDPLTSLKNTIEQKCQLLENLLTIKTRYENINTSYTNTNNKLTKIKEHIDSLLKQYKDVLNNLEVCPLCYSSIDKNRIENIINSYK
ncbi:MAG: AAA family ATPase [Tissierellia bacterium]|nr:AAA family ATPase [Tissierellia bacterium]